ncbi:hypothetical protein FHW88_001043 [Mucilaginibacter sp. SG538B]|uniref:hypothetical protein n=1 Tax=Mucilaginibacter TaxID=423349 RepID=UPI00159D3FB3|nr:hypothetical protein [Mucilaginibacter sp. SG538B]NVM62767.1 hypothetical protein [Mucilaginibacter sp. SG538B]
MTFPFSVHFDRPLKAIITPDNKEQILQCIKNSILEDKADNIVVQDLTVCYKGSTSNWRGSLFGSVDNGIFYLIYKNNSWFLDYQINMRELFIVTSIMSTAMEVFMLVNGGPWWVGIAAFLWLCGANWILNLVRHGGVADDIAARIDRLICGKTELPGEDKMTGKLKSWF